MRTMAKSFTSTDITPSERKKKSLKSFDYIFLQQAPVALKKSYWEAIQPRSL